MTWHAVIVVTGFGLLAIVGGGVLTAIVFRVVDDSASDRNRDGVDEAGAILRGGAWIGALERVAVYAGLVAGWKEAIAVALAVKGLGRYPELRNRDTPAVAERFIIGTFVSVLWACGCAGFAVWAR